MDCGRNGALVTAPNLATPATAPAILKGSFSQTCLSKRADYNESSVSQCDHNLKKLSEDFVGSLSLPLSAKILSFTINYTHV